MVKVLRLSEPSSEPITTAEAKARLDVTFSDDDDQIAAMISAGRRAVEDYCNRAFVQATWAVLYDGDLPSERTSLCLPLPDVSAVTSISYLDANLASQTWAESGNWSFDGERREITPDSAWPSGTKLRVAVTAGNGDSPISIPPPIRQAILYAVWDMYEPHSELWDRAKVLADPYRERLGV